jgi:ABC-2 type transport system permease protein
MKIELKHISSLKFHVIANKTLRDISKWYVTLTFIGLSTFIPFILAITVLPDMKLANYPVEMQFLQLRDYLFFITYFMIAGLVLSLFTAVYVSGFVASEVSSGTLLSLISKPLKRWEILFGKFIAFFIYITILETTSIIISIYILVTFSGCNSSLILPLIGYIPVLLIYTLFVTLVFGAITITFSTICKSRSSALMITVGLILLIYLVFFILRTVGAGFYATYQLYHIDLGYHLSNVFILILENNSIDLTPMTQMMISMFSGTYDMSSMVNLFEPDQGFMMPTLELAGYYEPWQSCLIWLLIVIGLISLALFNLNRKEVN